jgi:ketosteroid isomerase-like protein
MSPASLSDWFEVHNLFVRYTTSLDACDVESVVDCFAPDGWLESPVLGRFEGQAGIRAFVERTIKVRDERGGQFRHVISNLRVETEGDRGVARCYLLDYLTIAGHTELLSPGEYRCVLVRNDDGWKLASRTVHMDRTFPPPDVTR